MTGLTQAEFARRSSCSQTTVSKALRAGRLSLLPDGGIDPAYLNTRWRMVEKPEPSVDAPLARKQGRPLKKPVDKASAETAASFAAVALQKEKALAALRTLELEQKAGQLVDLDTAKRVMFEASRAMRDAWLNWPSRVAPGIAAALGVDADALMRALSVAVHEQLSQVGAPDFDSGES